MCWVCSPVELEDEVVACKGLRDFLSDVLGNLKNSWPTEHFIDV